MCLVGLAGQTGDGLHLVHEARQWAAGVWPSGTVVGRARQLHASLWSRRSAWGKLANIDAWRHERAGEAFSAAAMRDLPTR